MPQAGLGESHKKIRMRHFHKNLDYLMRRQNETQTSVAEFVGVAILAGGEDIVSRHAARRADGEVIHAHQFADEGADRLGLRGEL